MNNPSLPQGQGGQGVPEQGTSQGPSLMGSQLGSNLTGSNLQKIMGMYALSKGDPSQAWSILQPNSSEINRQQKQEETDAALAGTADTAGQMLTQWNNMPEWEKRIPQAIVNLIPAVSPTRAGINTTFYTSIEPDLRKAMIGGRITQQEVSWLRDALLPTPRDSYESASAKIKALTDNLNKKIKSPKYRIGPQATSQDNSWEVVSP